MVSVGIQKAPMLPSQVKSKIAMSHEQVHVTIIKGKKVRSYKQTARPLELPLLDSMGLEGYSLDDGRVFIDFISQINIYDCLADLEKSLEEAEKHVDSADPYVTPTFKIDFPDQYRILAEQATSHFNLPIDLKKPSVLRHLSKAVNSRFATMAPEPYEIAMVTAVLTMMFVNADIGNAVVMENEPFGQRPVPIVVSPDGKRYDPYHIVWSHVRNLISEGEKVDFYGGFIAQIAASNTP